MIKVRINFTPASGARSNFEDCKAVDPSGVVWESISGRWLRLTPLWVDSLIGPDSFELAGVCRPRPRRQFFTFEARLIMVLGFLCVPALIVVPLPGLIAGFVGGIVSGIIGAFVLKSR